MADAIDQIKIGSDYYDISIANNSSVTVSSFYASGASYKSGEIVRGGNIYKPSLYVNGADVWATTATSCTIYAPTQQVYETAGYVNLLGSSAVDSLSSLYKNSSSTVGMSGGYLISNSVTVALMTHSATGGPYNPIYVYKYTYGSCFRPGLTFAGGTQLWVNDKSHSGEAVSLTAPSTTAAYGGVWCQSGILGGTWLGTATSVTNGSMTVFTSTATAVPSSLPTSTCTAYYSLSRPAPSTILVAIHINQVASADKHYFIPLSAFSSYLTSATRAMAILADPVRWTANGNAAKVFTQWWKNGTSGAYQQNYGSISYSTSVYAQITIDENTVDGLNALLVFTNCSL